MISTACAADFQFPAEAEDDVRQPARLGDGRAFRRHHHNVHCSYSRDTGKSVDLQPPWFVAKFTVPAILAARMR